MADQLPLDGHMSRIPFSGWKSQSHATIFPGSLYMLKGNVQREVALGRSGSYMRPTFSSLARTAKSNVSTEAAPHRANCACAAHAGAAPVPLKSAVKARLSVKQDAPVAKIGHPVEVQHLAKQLTPPGSPKEGFQPGASSSGLGPLEAKPVPSHVKRQAEEASTSKIQMGTPQHSSRPSSSSASLAEPKVDDVKNDATEHPTGEVPHTPTPRRVHHRIATPSSTYYTPPAHFEGLKSQ
ncbi:hypothetical protein RvY_03211 [Ramazzottius varieornatus]|uniref:Uncharacterized protein n=1 Tax=Ramazzottius varieornatus TaxID=947166 RepID=A0A1D1UN47_RAMVA|nr:hypothetical protein RvY_03211 [Ramazzottius varieornatus]